MLEPPRRPVTRLEAQGQRNPYEGRWRWWYSAIADWMIANPDKKLADCAAALGRHVNTISLITSTDMFKEYLARRKEEYRKHHDFAILSKVTKVAERGLDLLLDKIDKKGDQIPMALALELTTSALDRLGYAPQQTPSAVVNVQQNDNRQQVVMVPVSPAALEEARDALRLAEQRRAIEAQEPSVQVGPPSSRSGVDTTGALEHSLLGSEEAEPEPVSETSNGKGSEVDLEDGVSDAPISLDH